MYRYLNHCFCAYMYACMQMPINAAKIRPPRKKTCFCKVNSLGGWGHPSFQVGSSLYYVWLKILGWKVRDSIQFLDIQNPCPSAEKPSLGLFLPCVSMVCGGMLGFSSAPERKEHLSHTWGEVKNLWVTQNMATSSRVPLVTFYIRWTVISYTIRSWWIVWVSCHNSSH